VIHGRTVDTTARSTTTRSQTHGLSLQSGYSCHCKDLVRYACLCLRHYRSCMSCRLVFTSAAMSAIFWSPYYHHGPWCKGSRHHNLQQHNNPDCKETTGLDHSTTGRFRTATVSSQKHMTTVAIEASVAMHAIGGYAVQSSYHDIQPNSRDHSGLNETNRVSPCLTTCTYKPST
jgi:hypothetical protein